LEKRNKFAIMDDDDIFSSKSQNKSNVEEINEMMKTLQSLNTNE